MLRKCAFHFLRVESDQFSHHQHYQSERRRGRRRRDREIDSNNLWQWTSVVHRQPIASLPPFSPFNVMASNDDDERPRDSSQWPVQSTCTNTDQHWTTFHLLISYSWSLLILLVDSIHLPLLPFFPSIHPVNSQSILVHLPGLFLSGEEEGELQCFDICKYKYWTTLQHRHVHLSLFLNSRYLSFPFACHSKRNVFAVGKE